MFKSSQQLYQSLLPDHGIAASLSTNASSATLEEGESEKQNFENSTRKSFLSRILTIRNVLIVNACLLLCLISMQAWHMMGSKRASNDEQFIMRAYGSNERYMSLDHNYDILWEDDSAVMKAGVISVSDSEIGAISMFHQLHCLVALRTALQKAYDGEKIAYDYHEDKHWPHCLDYLRQMVLCQADDQIEAGQIWKAGHPPVVDGSIDIRKCRNPDVLYQLYSEKKLM